MEALTTMLPSYFYSTEFYEFLLSTITKSTFILLTAVIIVRWWKGASATTKHFIYTIAIAGSFLVVLLTFISSYTEFESINYTKIISSIGLTDVNSQVVDPSLSEALVLPHWSAVAALIWVMGISFLLLRLLVGKLCIWSLLRGAKVCTDVRIKDIFSKAKGDIDEGRRVCLLIAKKASVPFVFGNFSSTIVLPEESTNWSSSEIRRVLLHELAHVKRRDVPTTLIAQLVAVLFWFNPLIWLTTLLLRFECERACDEYVIASGENASDYAEQLLKYSRKLAQPMLCAPIGLTIVRKTFLKKRIQLLCTVGNYVVAMRPAIMMLVITLTLITTLALAVVRTPVEDNVEFPEMIYEEVPVYPAEAAEADLAGLVWVKAYVDANGDVQNTMLQKTSGYEYLDNAALEAAKKCKFNPMKRNGFPEQMWVTFSYRFDADEKE